MKEKKNGRKRVTAIIAVAAGAALLIGGSTYALWSATANIDGGTIAAGDLQLAAGDMTSYDVSADRSDSTVGVVKDANGMPITFNAGEADKVENLNAGDDELQGHQMYLNREDGENWLIVPKDTAAVLLPYTVTLKGDNLVAALTIDSTAMVEAQENTDMVYSYAVFDDQGQQIGETNLVTKGGALPIALFQANGVNQDEGQDDTYNDAFAGPGTVVPMVDVDGTAKITLVIFAHFNDTGDTQARDNHDASDVLGNITATLTQVREGTDLFPSASASEATTEG